ncbi:hypothetical protein HT031_006370 [Scenedesmus sp. PABB004]|nr:hypothetical protein HT031_006370 [Scenedesmus sp. PABB004]
MAAAAEAAVLGLITQHNKPFGVQGLVDNLQSAGIKKAAVVKACDALTDAGRIVCKEFGKTKLFIPKQEGLEVLSKEDTDAAKAELKALHEALVAANKAVKETEAGAWRARGCSARRARAARRRAAPAGRADARRRRARAELRSWSSSMTAEQLAAKLADLTQRRDAQLGKLAQLRSGAKLVRPEERRATEVAFRQAMEVWRKRRSVFRGIWDTISEGIEGKQADLFEEIGVDTDEAAGQRRREPAAGAMQRSAGVRAGSAPCRQCAARSIAGRRVAARAGSGRVVAGGKVFLDPVQSEATAFAPATIANLGPGFDWLGCAVEGDGDTVTARVLKDQPGAVVIEAIRGDGGRLSLDPSDNCIGIAASETLKLLGSPSCGVALTLDKGLPLGSGMGSSAASAAAAAWAVNGLFGSPLSKSELVVAGLASEAAVSGYHADNVGPALLGGFVLVRSCDPLELVPLPFAGANNAAPLWFVLVNPCFEAPTKQMRAVLPQEVPFKSMIHNSCQGGALVAAILGGDAELLGSALDSDVIVEPVRAPLIPGLLAVKAAAKAAGAYGCTISGAGPTAVAVVPDPDTGARVAEAMGAAFRGSGGLEVNSAKVVALDPEGAKFVPPLRCPGGVVAAMAGAVVNWGLTQSSTPAAVASADSAEAVAAVVRDAQTFPSPLLAVGSLHSVNGCVTCPGGTILHLKGLNKILGLEPGPCVRLQAGVTLADAHDFLAQHDLELSFSPEIGDATVGSLAVCTSKDSSLDGPGYLSALVSELTYVDESGRFVKLSKAATPDELAAFTCSYGMMGVVVEVVLEARRRVAVTSTSFTLLAADGATAAAKLAKLYAKSDALFAILVPGRNYVYVEQRMRAPKLLAPLARGRAAAAVATISGSEIAYGIMFNTKYKCFLYGNPPGRKLSKLFAGNRYPLTHFRRVFVNRYPRSQRLDFSFIEFDLTSPQRFQVVVEGCWAFHAAYAKEHGYGPRGYGIYFVTRDWGAPGAAAAKAAGDAPPPAPDAGGRISPAGSGDAAVTVVSAAGGAALAPRAQHVRKPVGNFSGGPGVSFMLDPITDNPDHPHWLPFNAAYTAWAVSQGGAPSLSQTKGLVPGQASLPARLTRQRFLTPYFAQYVE